MNIKRMAWVAAVVTLFAFSPVALALDPIQLPRPLTEGGKPLMRALKDRKSSRNFIPRKLHLQTLSNLLWAANGISRPAEGKRTAPSAMNLQPIDIYVALADGLYLFNAKDHRLAPVTAKDLRAMTGTQSFVKDAAVNLVYVADLSRMGTRSAADKDFYAAVNTGYISQNVYLFCASEGLATVVRRSMDVPALSREMGLRPDQKIVLAQSIGYPKK